MEEKKSRLTPLVNSFSKNAIEERLTTIMKIKKFTIPAILVAIILVVGLTVVFATTSNAVTDNTVRRENDASISGNVEDTPFSKLERELERLEYIKSATVFSDNDLLRIDLALDGTAHQLSKEQIVKMQKLANEFNDKHKPLQISIVDGPASTPDLSGNGDAEAEVSAPAHPKST